MTLKEACDEHLLDSDLIARDGKTFCNIFVQRVSKELDCSSLNGLTANQIYDLCNQDKDWSAVDPDVAHAGSKQGYLVIAAIKDRPHGHVAICYPSLMVYSGKWRRYCPQVASVGAKNGIFGCNWAFKEMPTFFLYKGGVVNPR